MDEPPAHEVFGSAIVANKLDQAEFRQVPKKDGEETARRIGALHFETSAKDKHGMAKVLQALTESMLSPSEERYKKSRTRLDGDLSW
jgi:putative ribosome biogenesis GTPase RsgA